MHSGSRRHGRRLLPWLSSLIAAMPMGPAAARTSGAALVVGIDDQAGKADHPCVQAAQDVGARLGGQGIAVQALTNPSDIELRSAIDDFAAGLEGAAPETALVYVCGPAAAAGSRLFVMPSGASPDADVQLATQGIILQAFLNTLADAGGTVFADLGMAAPADETARAQGDRVPAGVHLTLNLSLRGDGAWVGRTLAGTSIELSQGWDAVADGIAASRPSDAVSLLPPSTLADAEGIAGLSDPADAAPPAPTAVEPDRDASAAQPADDPHAAQASAITLPPPGRAALPVRLPDAGVQARGRPFATPAATARIERLQAALARKDFYHGPVDGRLSPYTQRGVRLFQRSLHAPETGALTQAEIIRLLNE